MKHLDFVLSMTDKVTRPLKGVQNSITTFASKAQKNFAGIGAAVGVMYGAGTAIRGMLDPAIQLDRALGEAGSMGIADDAIKQISKSALMFSASYGKSATDFIQSTYKIRGAVRGLTDAELPKFAVATNTLGAALRTSGEAAAEYVGAMHGKFKNYADSIGNVKFAEQLAGQTAYLRQQFGVDMAAIQGFFDSSKGVGNQLGVSMGEQLAIFGQLQTTLKDAGPAYYNFMKNAVGGAQKLGMSFTDSKGNMLGMVDIMAKLKKRYGDTLDAKEIVEINKIFGKGGEVVKHLWGQTDKLKKTMAGIGDAANLQGAVDMVDKMTDPWERMESIFFAIRAAIGQAIQPVLYPIINKFLAMGQTLAKWLTMFPNIARWIGYIIGLLAGGAAIGALVTLISLFGSLAMSALAVAAPILLVVAVLAGIGYVIYRLWKPIKAFFSGFIQGFLETSGMGERLSRMFKIIGAVIGWIGQKIGELLDWLGTSNDGFAGAAQSGLSFGRIVGTAVNLLFAPFDILMSVLEYLPTLWDDVCRFFNENSPFDMLMKLCDTVINMFKGLFRQMITPFIEVYNWVVDKLNKIPGIKVDAMPIDALTAGKAVGLDNQSPLTGGRLDEGASKGLTNSVSSVNSKSSSVDKSMHINSLTIQTGDALTPEQLLHEFQEKMAG